MLLYMLVILCYFEVVSQSFAVLTRDFYDRRRVRHQAANAILKSASMSIYYRDNLLDFGLLMQLLVLSLSTVHSLLATQKFLEQVESCQFMLLRIILSWTVGDFKYSVPDYAITLNVSPPSSAPSMLKGLHSRLIKYELVL